MEDGLVSPVDEGTPQGGPLSPLLSNIVLDEFDREWERRGVRFAELRKRGVGKDLAAQTAGSAHGPWRLADSPALHFALPNAYFDSLGIPRLTGGR